MKIKNFLFAGLAMLVVCACGSGSKTSDTTILTGLFEGEAPAQVQIKLSAADLDTLVDVVNGKFMYKLATDKLSMGLIKAGDVSVRFIPDGTDLTINFNGTEVPVITSSNPGASLQAKYDEAVKTVTETRAAFQEQMKALREAGKGEEAADSLYEAYSTQNKAFYKDLIAKNPDNYLGRYGLDAIRYSIPDDELEEVVNMLSPELDKTGSLTRIKDGIAARRATAVGKPFTDFTVGEQKLSDFAGKGKYLLVDFWASWCGPCRREVPFIKEVYEKYHQDTFDVLSVAVWEQSVADTDKAAAELGITWNQIKDAQKIPTDLYGINGIPHLMLIGPDGTILARDIRGKGIEEEVSKYVKPVK